MQEAKNCTLCNSAGEKHCESPNCDWCLECYQAMRVRQGMTPNPSS